MPPSLMLKDVSGITASIFTLNIVPKPLQVGQAPYGELNEKELGEGSS
jgi:hypothetical protein